MKCTRVRWMIAVVAAGLVSHSFALRALAQGSDACPTAQPISGNGSFFFNLLPATTGPEGQACTTITATGTDNDVWFLWTPTCTGLAFIDTCGSTVDTKLSYYFISTCPAPAQQALCCDDDSCGLQSALNCEARCEQPVLIQVGNSPGAPAGSGFLNISCVPYLPPNGKVCCQPRSDQLSCEPTQCLNAAEICRPTEISVIPGTPPKVLKCDCTESNVCHVDYTAAAGAFCTGGCPNMPPQVCELLQSDTDGDGVPDRFRCDCVPPPPPDCRPTPDLKACEPTICPIATEKCKPKEIEIDPATGAVQVLSCDCQEGNECHIQYTTAGGPTCTGGCPGPGGQTCELSKSDTDGDGNPDRFRCDCVPPITTVCEPSSDLVHCKPTICPVPTDLCRPTKIKLFPGATNLYETIECDCRADGECHVEVTAQGPVCMGDCPNAGDICRMFQADSDGDGQADIFGCDCIPPPPPKCEPTSDRRSCKATVCAIPGEICRPTHLGIDSNGQIIVLNCDCIRDECHIEIDATGQPTCPGTCPNATDVCQLFSADSDGDGVIDVYSCDCVPPPPPVCKPNKDRTACEPTLCPNTGEKCRPTQLGVDPLTGQQIVLACDCLRDDECHVQLGGPPPSQPICVGLCPPGPITQTCELLRSDTDGDGVPDVYSCDCVPPVPNCEVTPDQKACKPTICPIATEICRPVELGLDPLGGGLIVRECDCRPETECHIKWDPQLGFQCPGQCPLPGQQTCELRMSDLNGDGHPDMFRCDCDQPPPPCQPTADRKACEPTVCLNQGEICRPTEFGIDPLTGQYIVNGCDCVRDDECHLEFNATGPVCVSPCPIATDQCRLNQSDIDGDGVPDLFRCDCLTPPQCQPKPDHTACEPTICPIAGEICRPTLVHLIPGTTIVEVLACDCMRDNECHVVYTGVPPSADCAGLCPNPNDVCERFQVAPDNFGCNCVPADGACCLGDGTCIMTTAAGCQGVFHAGQFCTTLEACCLLEQPGIEFCQMIDPLCCVDLGGTPGGTGSVCTGNAVACCNPTTSTCTMTDAFCCQLHGGVALPAGTNCNNNPCDDVCEPNPQGSACNQVACPTNPSNRCVPTKLSCVPAPCRIVECRCASPDICHVNLPQAGTNQPFCSGICPPGKRCVRRRIDTDSNGSLDGWECRCVIVHPTPTGDPTLIAKGRYVSAAFSTPQEGEADAAQVGVSQAIRIKLISLPAPFSAFNGTFTWAGPAQQVTEVASSSATLPAPFFMASNLQCTENFADYGSVGLLHMSGAAIVPNGMYAVQIVDIECADSLDEEDCYSDPLNFTVPKFGDIAGVFDNGCSCWTGPNGIVDFQDVGALVDKFKNLPTAPIKVRSDLAGNVPNRVIDFRDIGRAVDAFKGLPYQTTEFSGPPTCP